MFQKILIANRGEIACRIIKTAQKMGIKTVAVYSEADKSAKHVQIADEAVHIGPAPAAQSYLVIDKIIQAAKETGAQAIHPGYGFLSENPAFCEELAKSNIAFIGPGLHAIKSMGDKITSKKIAQEAGVSIVPGFMGLIDSEEDALKISRDIGYPVMIKASAGGGGKGMRVAYDDDDVREGFNASKREASHSFGDDRIFIEKYITQPRHIEIQILCDRFGNGIHLLERECSIQRRNQKIIEEAPSSFLDDATRKKMGEQALALAHAVKYSSAGTVEFIVDGDRNFYFLEMNTRLQVEHPVTELITGVDLVEHMIRIANDEKLSLAQDDIQINGWALESRLYAEDPYRNFLPSIGRLSRYRPPQERAEESYIIRNDTGVYEGADISTHYDPMIAKLCTWAPTRLQAIEKMKHALDQFEIEGIGHNLPFCSAVMQHPKFMSGDISTAFIPEEYPDGFAGIEPDQNTTNMLAACAGAMYRIAEVRRTRVSGRLDNHTRIVGDEWIIKLLEQSISLNIEADAQGANVTINEKTYRVEGSWLPGQTLAQMNVNGETCILKVNKIHGGFRIRHAGSDLNILIETPRMAELSKHMLKKARQDTSNLLLCPMPGLLVKLDAHEGQHVEIGQNLCTIEAMKMENIFKAERKAIISKIHITEGQTMAVDDVILEFET